MRWLLYLIVVLLATACSYSGVHSGRGFDEAEALRRFERPEVAIDADLGAGSASATVWTCDLTHDYVTINGDYRS